MRTSTVPESAMGREYGLDAQHGGPYGTRDTGEEVLHAKHVKTSWMEQ
ncbi:MAG: hypothetical protein OXC02_09045 [Rhodobacteraceae bacterium]|nr:hypothetical protein [Paracoccaceae bacterium]